MLVIARCPFEQGHGRFVEQWLGVEYSDGAAEAASGYFRRCLDCDEHGDPGCFAEGHEYSLAPNPRNFPGGRRQIIEKLHDGRTQGNLKYDVLFHDACVTFDAQCSFPQILWITLWKIRWK